MASRSWNRVELIGNLTRDPELRYTPSGAAVCTFGIATNRTYVTEGERKEEVDFHRLVAWNKLAELCNQLLKKGNRVFISGRLQTRTWEGQDGQSRTVTEIVIEDMILLTPKADGGVYAAEEPVEGVTVPEEVPASATTQSAPVAKPAAKATGAKTTREKTQSVEEEAVTEAPPKEELNDEDLPF